MTEQSSNQPSAPDYEEMTRTLQEITAKSQEVVSEFLRQEQSAQHVPMEDAAQMGQLFQQLSTRMMADPARLVEAQMAFWADYMSLMQNMTLRMWGANPDPVAQPDKGDRRFKHQHWEDHPVFDYIKQTYLLTSDYLHTVVSEVEGLDDKTKKKVDFYTRAFIDAMAPSNFAVTNPEVLEKTAETGGQNLLQGLNNLLDDLKRGRGRLDIKMTDYDAFEVGKNLATTPGKVVYQNELMQLIQYQPNTEKVHARPLLLVPAWINKYYIMDLSQDKSMVSWLVNQGHTVFIISWKNPDESLAEKRFENYMLEGPIEALDLVESITGSNEINVVGYCLGGTLTACTLAYLAAKGDQRVKAATFLTCLLDFEYPGELEVFIDDDQLETLERRMDIKGYLDGRQMSTTFNMLRANDLIWSFFVNNYLKGDEPFPFDLLYWNSDSTNMPAKMHSFYLRNMYQRNLLKEPGGIELAGEPIDLARIEIPAYFMSAREDHIAPWKSTIRGPRLLSGPTKYVLGGSGHIAGVINPPHKNKYGYWTNTDKTVDQEQWLSGATPHEGSWWNDWGEWLAEHGGAEVKARKVGSTKYKPIEDAPGSYVREGVLYDD
ncbi:polyhydroxyalkanoic acid synthase [Halorhodospira halochloris]|uniref:Polyhydroxyalkanoic acid synthase n=1 Tax=Halorhodospira halochloris TaxID=1052 RepID=A0A125T2Q9_HALHR|nr:class I poly(R)-hydroxyalkanoic acid synthase [Halorhodospira halochloris]MBK1651631.1 class I poly(R)-hydroxyalkanoic acid synthase [Halorhodospira halochloris]MCG5548168.1 class I poly(R)-hydroxyalkanoic acid synthase [Halorhodospira halochloris]BAU58493.1 polyhydroxyalkanoic acid synthase [Halorhodospira halochloris]